VSDVGVDLDNADGVLDEVNEKDGEGQSELMSPLLAERSIGSI
jgi:hypothetical protein